MKAKTFRKTFPMLPAIALTAATLALTAALPARATTFIKDVMLIGGTLSETTELKTQYQAQGWSVINYDLNHGCSGSTDYIFLLYKAEEDTSGDRDYITGFYIKTGASDIVDSFASYRLVPYDGGAHFKSQKGDLNSNAGGDAIHLYYIRSSWTFVGSCPRGNAITSITFNDTPDGALPENGVYPMEFGGMNYIYLGYDLNAGAGGDYVYMHVSSAPVTYGIYYDLQGGVMPSTGSPPTTYDINTPDIRFSRYYNPYRSGYWFAGWSWPGSGDDPQAPEDTIIEQGSCGNKYYTANWTPEIYSIYYYYYTNTVNGRTVYHLMPDGLGNPETYIADDPVFTLNEPTRPHYTFVGWTWGGQPTPTKPVTIPPTDSLGEKIYLANWTPVDYTITYDLAGGSMPSGTSNPATYNIETPTFTLNDPTRGSDTFLGWTWSGQSTPVKPVTITCGTTSNKSYTANWSVGPVGYVDSCTGGEGRVSVVGWAYDPDVSSESINVQVKVYKQNGTTLVGEETFVANRPRDDVNSRYNITGQHGYSATIFNLVSGTYKVMVIALDQNGESDKQIGSTRTVTVSAAATVAYIDELGVARQCGTYTVITNTAGGASYGRGGAESWYVVPNNVTVGGPLVFNDAHAHLILCDGASLSAPSIQAAGSLTVCCQANATGILSVTGSGIAATSVTLNGGAVTTTGIDAANITFGWTRTTDSITVGSYRSSEVAVTVRSGQTLTDNSDVYRDSVLASAIAGKTLWPYVGTVVPYVDENGVTQKCLFYTAFTNTASGVSYGTGGEENWYAITNNVTINGPLRFNDGNTRLILCDGATLTVTNANGAAIEAGNLIIYGQTNGTGTVTASGDDGINASNYVTIYGGTVAANGGNDGYGIYASRTVTIRGGTVTANATENGCGIGARVWLVIRDGAVTANGGSYGIISAFCEDSEVSIKGGAVTAHGGIAGICSTYVDISCDVNLGTVATVTATGGDYGIYAVKCSDYFTPEVDIVAGNVTANGDIHGVCADEIILGRLKLTDSITVSSYDGTVIMYGRLTDGSAAYESGHEFTPDERDAIAGKTIRPAFRLTLPEGVVASGVVTQDVTTAYALPGAVITVSAATPGYGIGEVFYVPADGEGWDKVVTSLDGFSASFTVTDEEILSSNCDITVSARTCVPIPYIDENGNEKLCGGYTVLASTTGNLHYGYDGYSGTAIYNMETWYVVTNNVTIKGSLYLQNAARLILCDGATLAITESPVDGSLSARILSIYCQTNGTGRVTVTRGLGANDLTINGGIVTAEGKSDYSNRIGGNNITINGGTVTVTGIESGIYTAGRVNDEGEIETITLGWTKPTDSIFISRYSSYWSNHGYYGSYRYRVVIAPGQALTDGSAVYEGTLDDAQIVAIGGKTLRPYIADPPFPSYLDGADDQVKTNYVSWAMRNGYDMNGEHEAAFLLNVAPEDMPAEFRIDGIEADADGAAIRVVACRADASAGIDLSKINGILTVATGDDLNSLTPKAIPAANVSYNAETGSATILIPASAGTFAQARIEIATPTVSLPATP